MTTHATVPLPQTPKRPLLPRPGPGALAQVSLQRKGYPRPGPLNGRECPSWQRKRASSLLFWVLTAALPVCTQLCAGCIWMLTWVSFTKSLSPTFPQQFDRRCIPSHHFRGRNLKFGSRRIELPAQLEPGAQVGKVVQSRWQPASTSRLESREAGGRPEQAGPQGPETHSPRESGNQPQQLPTC